MNTVLKKWYAYLSNKCIELNSGIVYKSTSGKKLLLSDIFIHPNIVQDAVFGIGKNNIKRDNIISLGDRYESYTTDDMLSNTRNNRHLVIGSLGSGKTCLLNYYIMQIARYKLQGKQTDSKVVSAYKDKFMSCVFFKEITGETKTSLFSDLDLNGFIKSRLKLLLNDAERKKVDDHFDELINEGIILFVDGLDEIDIEERRSILKAINLFCANPDNVVISTIRKEVLVEDLWINEISDYQQITLADFSPEQIKNFICKWRRETSSSLGENIQNEDKIINTILNDNYLKELAANPLFLTLMMLIAEENSGEFPKSRTKVFEEAVKLIIERWNKKNIDSTVEASQIRSALEQAAYNGMNNLIRQNKKSGDISAFISDAFTKSFPDKKVAEYIKAVSEKTGIIVQTENSKYAFALQSFMEYFAACYISSYKIDIAQFIEEQTNYLISWQEVIVFGVTKLALDHLELATSILFGLVKTDYNFKNRINPEIVLVSGMITREILCESSNSNIIMFKKRIKTWLKKYISDRNISFRLRFEIGNVLEHLGDDRKGVGIIRINQKKYPDIEWISIPEGISEFGSAEGHINKVHCKYTGNYYISKYPVTNAQYALFIENGYSTRRYWTKEGWAWLNGQKSISIANVGSERYSEDRKKQYELWLTGREQKRRNEPYWWQDYPWNIANRPVVGVTWYEAVAYCNWLNIECRIQMKEKLSDDEYDNAQICLPTLEEWEKAARGPKCSKYPWGEKLDEKYKIS